MAESEKRGKLLRRPSHHGSASTRARIGLPAAIVGSIALSLSTVSAFGAPVADGDRDRDPQHHPSPLRALGAVTVTGTAPVASVSSTTVVGMPAAAATSYTVKPGDTISAIAARHGLRTKDVLAWNGLGWSSTIYPGQKLTLSGAAAASTPAAAPAAATGAKTYTVKRGDTLWAISARNGVSLSSLMKLNGLTGRSVIHPGQKLKLAAGTVAHSSGSTPAASKPGNNTPAASTPPAAKTHTVVRGDTLWAIARAHGVSVSSLLTMNGLKSSSIIYPGQKLTLKLAATPASSTRPAAPATAPQPAPAGASHTIAAGETLWAIAQSNGTSMSALLSANGLTEASIIYPGQKLVIPSATGLDAAQIANAKLIIGVGRDRGVSDRGIAIALATAMVESGIRNLDYGDRDSLGLFQQRPSQGWGTAAQILDPYRSTAVFYGGSGDPNGRTTRGLLDIPGWESMAFTDAAQAVQISAFPDRYGQWESKAYGWLAALG